MSGSANLAPLANVVVFRFSTMNDENEAPVCPKCRGRTLTAIRQRASFTRTIDPETGKPVHHPTGVETEFRCEACHHDFVVVTPPDEE
jgi:hypothetical protein